MRRHLIVAGALIAALVLPALAAAKGPESASLSGPGLSRSLAVVGEGEGGTGTPLGALVDLGGFFPQMYGQSPDPTLRTQPKGSLGPAYKITYVVPGPNSIKSHVVQDVYPYAKPVPLTYMKPGQSFWGTKRTLGGWFRASTGFKRVLVQAGLPKAAPRAQTAGFWTPGAAGGIAGAVALLGLAFVARPRRWRRN